MGDPWVHVGRLWTNGDPYLAIDAELRGAWHGFSNDDYFDQVVPLGWQDTSLPVGTGRALLVGADGVVGDDAWLEVFQAEAGQVAIVQASGPDYPHILATALGWPTADDQDGDAIHVGSGELTLFSAASDGTGPYSSPLVPARPEPVPLVAGPPTSGEDPGLLISTRHAGYKLKVRWHTRLDQDSCLGEDGCFARWLLIPVPGTAGAAGVRRFPAVYTGPETG